MRVAKNLRMPIVRLIATAIIVTIILLSMGIRDALNLKKTNGGLDINTMQESEFEDGTHIKGDIGFCFGQFAEEDTTDKTNKEYYYILPLTQFDDDLKYIAVVCSNDKDVEEIERLTDETIDYMNDVNASDPVPISDYQGKLVEMDDDVKQLMVEYFQEAEIYENDNEINSHILPYTLKHSTIKDTYIILAIGVGLVLIFVVIISFIAIRRIKINKRNQANQNIGPDIM